MAVYKFKVVFEDYDEVVREIEIKSSQTFEDFHHAIHQSIGFKPEYESSFYISNDFWHKGFEITTHKERIKDASKGALMKDCKMSSYIEDPHQKFYYIFDFKNPWNFQIELMRILDEDPKKVYPLCVKSTNEAPRQFIMMPTGTATEEDLILEDLDDEEDEMDPLGIKSIMTEEDDQPLGEEEEDETSESEEEGEMDEFSDNNDDGAGDDY